MELEKKGKKIEKEGKEGGEEGKRDAPTVISRSAAPIAQLVGGTACW